MKQTFNIPEGCKTVSVEQIGNQLITSFEPEKYVPEKGDLVKVVSPVFANIFIFECAGRNGNDEPLEAGDTIFNGKLEKKDDVGHCIDSDYTKLTREEFQTEFDNLGYVYDFETHTAHKKRWKAKNGEKYYFINGAFKVERDVQDIHLVHDKRYENGNHFRNEVDAETYRDYMLKQSLNFHKNNQ